MHNKQIHHVANKFSTKKLYIQYIMKQENQSSFTDVRYTSGKKNIYIYEKLKIKHED